MVHGEAIPALLAGAALEFKADRAIPEECEAAPENAWLEFRDSPIHGRGGFARRLIPEGTQIIEYVGRRISKDESARLCEEENHYIFNLGDDFDLDGDVEWNPARLINHSCDPNCHAEQDGDRIFIFAQRDIRPGEELSFNYGYELENYRDHPCRCSTARCVGYIVAEEYHDLVRQETPAPGAGTSPV